MAIRLKAGSNPRQRHHRWALHLLVPCCAMALTLAWAVPPAQATTQTFEYTGAEQTFTVPGGVRSVHVIAIGGAGGIAGGSTPGGAAARVSGELEVTPGQTLYVEVGGKGEDNSEGGEGGFNGGADGAGGGGGASDIRTSPRVEPASINSRLIVAAGGGGGGGDGLGPFGGAGGEAGSPGSEASGAAGGKGGGAGTASEGGAGGEGCGEYGVDGQPGLGGSGGSNPTGGPGGGGGGGFFGGGGGGGGCSGDGSGGAGGGSSLVPAGGIPELASLVTPPQVQITYTPVPSIEIASPANGAAYTMGQVVAAAYSCSAPEGTEVKTCAGPVPNGAALDTAAPGQHTFTVNAEDTDGATAEKTVTYTVVASPAVGDTILGSHPRKTLRTRKKKVRVSFRFSSTVAGASFQCKLDKSPFTPCTSPKSYRVKPGRHKFSVRAVSAVGADSTPAGFDFKVKRKR